jgi:DNA-binding CsgD family transcriptional regulator
VVALLAALAPPARNYWLAVLILWVGVYNGGVTLALQRIDDDMIRLLVRAAAIVDGLSLMVLMGIYFPHPPPVLLAVYPCVLIEMVTFDGAIGGLYGVLIFIAGFSGLQLIAPAYSWNDVILWSVVMAITATSMTFSSQVMLRSAAADGIPAPPAPSRVPVPRLSARELEVLRLVAEGCSNSMIATRLHLSENTIKGHVEALLTHLNARNRAEAVAAAGRLDLL